MNSNNGRFSLHIFFFPFLACGHITPMLHMANLFSSRGVKATVVTTPLNASLIPHHDNDGGVDLQTINFPCHQETGLPKGCENLHSIPSKDLIPTFLKATIMLREPLERALSQFMPHCIVADTMFPWVTDSAARFGIPVLVFHGTCFFTLCAVQCMSLYRPFDVVSTDSEAFVIPGLPGEIEMTRTQVGHYVMGKEEPESMNFFEASEDSSTESYGIVVDSFYELEHDYVEYCRKVLGKKAWHVGPVSVRKRNTDHDKQEKDMKEESNTRKDECLRWLDTKKPNSVVYVCFGSLTSLPKSQLKEIAKGLEASGQQFIWVVSPNSTKDEEEEEEWLPEEYEKRMKGMGLIIRGWVPQVKILEHEAVGGFVTHCGWNSTLESVCAGVPMVTWPNYADQFYNEKLVTRVLKIGVGVGANKWSRLGRERIEWDVIEKAVKMIMEGEEAEEMRMRAKELAHRATLAMQEGGSSISSLDSLIHDLLLRSHH